MISLQWFRWNRFLVFSLTSFLVVFSNLYSSAQDSSVRIESDTLLINGDKVARYQVGEVKGKTVSIETFFFEKDGNQVYSKYLKLYEHQVRQDLQGRGMFKGYGFYFSYGINEVISPENTGVPESMEAKADTSKSISLNKAQIDEVGDQLIRAGQNLNAAVLLGLISGSLFTFLGSSLPPVIAITVGVGCAVVVLALEISGNSAIANAGRALKKSK